MQQIEDFSLRSDRMARELVLRNGKKVVTFIPVPPSLNRSKQDLAAQFELAWLQSKKSPRILSPKKQIVLVDLFAGCGGLSLGIREAARAIGASLSVRLAVDIDTDALAVFGLNFPEAELHTADVNELLDGKLGAKPTSSEVSLKARLGRVDILVGGPPCQGHSALNNHTRHKDTRNELYLRMARFCEIFRPTHVLIENVPGVLSDKNRVAQRTWKELEALGYTVQSATVDVSRIGVAQKRKRNLTVASLEVDDDLGEFLRSSERKPRPLAWAIKDLLHVYDEGSNWDSAPSPSKENSRRMKYLFDRELHELPDSQRPDCHRLKAHSYVSVYGRMYWDKPAQTITTGFGSMGRGRYVHPEKQRTITPHEAARIQYFPDFFNFGPIGRTLMQKLIGNAVPPKLGYVIGIFLLR